MKSIKDHAFNQLRLAHEDFVSQHGKNPDEFVTTIENMELLKESCAEIKNDGTCKGIKLIMWQFPAPRFISAISHK